MPQRPRAEVIPCWTAQQGDQKERQDRLLDRLDEMTGDSVVRIDQPVPRAFPGRVQSTDLFYEIAL